MRVSLSTGWAALTYAGYAALISLAFDRAWRLRRWQRNLVRAGGAFSMGWLSGLILILASQVIAWMQVLGRPIDRDAAFAAVVAVLVLLKANLIPKSRPAWFNGMTLPMLARDPQIWRRVHRSSAFRLVVIGLFLLALAVAHPPWLELRSMTIWLLVAEVGIASLHGLWLNLPPPPPAQH